MAGGEGRKEGKEGGQPTRGTTPSGYAGHLVSLRVAVEKEVASEDQKHSHKRTSTWLSTQTDGSSRTDTDRPAKRQTD